ncbi:MAG TPA: hypothetical protein PLE74_04765 [Candidatus Cloacimonadota bacterium]|nr:hypothetical protein [Candidatus Cloacimonadota bacterium]
MKLTTENLIRIALATLLVLCLFHMPYSFYQLFRYIAMAGFALLAYYQYERKNVPGTIVFVCLVLLFQPFVKIALGRQLWNLVDVVVAVGLVVSIFVFNRGKRTQDYR